MNKVFAIVRKHAPGSLVVGSAMLGTAMAAGESTVTASDIATVVAGIVGSVALVILIGNAKLLVVLAVRTYGWLRAAMR